MWIRFCHLTITARAGPVGGIGDFFPYAVNVDSGSAHYNEVAQDLNYYYDAAGNITTIRDDSQQTLFYNNSVVSPSQDFTYDALYRLVRAEGREAVGLASFGSEDNYSDSAWMESTPLPSNTSAVQRYIQKYGYDKAGNIIQLQHIADSGSYTRDFDMDSASNRLSGTAVGSDSYGYAHDARGNMATMPHLTAMDYDSLNQMSYVDNANVKAYYQYSGGQRIRKQTYKIASEERIYLGSFERYRKYDPVTNAVVLERTTVHVGDDSGRIGMLEVRTVGSDGSPASLKRFIYSNHLQSAALELDESGDIISYEEYYPYGTTAYQAMDSAIGAVAKRYRFTGKERDEESGLSYHGARYYIPWLCRWAAVDPLESKYTPFSPYAYVHDNPVNATDPSGMGDKKLEDTDMYKSGVIPYDYAEWKGWSPPSGSSGSARDNFKSGGYDIQPYYNAVDGKTSGEPLFYTASKKYDILEGEPNGGRTILKDHNRMEYLIMPWGINAFKKDSEKYERSADLMYFRGIGNFPGEHLGIDVLKGLDGNILGAIGEQWKGALKDPTFYLGLAAGVAEMGTNASENVAPPNKAPSNKVGHPSQGPNIESTIVEKPVRGNAKPNLPEGERVNVSYSGQSLTNAKRISILGLKDGMTTTSSNALDLGIKFLGENYSEPVFGTGRYVSADGTRVVRIGENDITGAHGGGPHVNFEILIPNPAKPGKMMVNQNLHIYIKF